jgi:hypothetical protein
VANRVTRALLKQDVIAGPAVENVLARSADQDIVTVTTGQGVITLASNQEIIAVIAILDKSDRAGKKGGSIDNVIAGLRIDSQPVVRCLGARDVDLGGETDYGNATAVAKD